MVTSRSATRICPNWTSSRRSALSVSEPDTDEDTGLTILTFFKDNVEVKLHGHFKLEETGDGLQVKGGKIEQIHAKKDGEDQWQIKNLHYKAVNFLDLSSPMGTSRKSSTISSTRRI